MSNNQNHTKKGITMATNIYQLYTKAKYDGVFRTKEIENKPDIKADSIPLIEVEELFFDEEIVL